MKCDRRTPCSSCLKRDTVQRCVYSQAAAEKIDVQSLHNRILILEGALAKLSSATPSSTVSSVLGSLPPFKEPFPAGIGSAFPSMSGIAGSILPSASTNHVHGPLAGQPSTDRALLAIGASGSSVVISLEDVASIWLGELDDLNGSLSILDSQSSCLRFHPRCSPYREARELGAAPQRLSYRRYPTKHSYPPPPHLAHTLQHPRTLSPQLTHRRTPTNLLRLRLCY